jgi:hypothetical protein
VVYPRRSVTTSAQDIAVANARLQAELTDYLPLRDYQAQAIRTIERHIAARRRELLVAMATGTAKTIIRFVLCSSHDLSTAGPYYWHSLSMPILTSQDFSVSTTVPV